MKRLTNPDFFDDALADVLEDYSTKILDIVNSETDKAAFELKNAIAADAPVETGKQKRSWRVSEPNKKTLRRYIGKALVVHSVDYRKVHLLENGHLTRNGKTRTKGTGFVSKNAEKTLTQYPKNIENAIKLVK